VRRVLGVTLVLMVLLSVQAAYAGPSDYDLFFDKVKLRPGVKCDIHVKVFVNEQNPLLGETVFAVSGWCHSAETWDQYAEALFTDPHTRAKISQVVAINQPGHGQSTLPTGISFGELLLDDYVTAILATLDDLQGDGIYPSEIIGHSQGGLLIQMLQERLLQSGSSLFEEYGISRAVLLAASPAAPVGWHVTTDGTADLLVALFLVPEGPVLGWHFDIPAWMWPYVFFVNFEGVPSPDAPTPAEIETRGYRAPGPLLAAMQLTGYANPIPGYPDQPFFSRPEASPGIFGLQSGTLLHVVGFEDDTMCPASECEAVFDHLIGSPVLSRYTLVEAEGEVHDRVHGLPISNPSVIIEAMSEHGW